MNMTSCLLEAPVLNLPRLERGVEVFFGFYSFRLHATESAATTGIVCILWEILDLSAGFSVGEMQSRPANEACDVVGLKVLNVVFYRVYHHLLVGRVQAQRLSAPTALDANKALSFATSLIAPMARLTQFIA